MSLKIEDKDNGYEALLKTVFGFGRPKILVGITEESGSPTYENGMSVAAIAEIHEFGLGVPERSFIRAWFDANKSNIERAIVKMLEGVVEGKRDKEQALELLGQKFAGEIQKNISAGVPPPNAPSTVARKGSSVPLIDTGQLRASVTYKVVR